MCCFTHRDIALAENVDDARVSASADAASPMRLVRRQQPPPVLVPSIPVQNLRPEKKKVFRKRSPNDGSSCVELKQRACTHSDDGVTDADVCEEEGQPAREGAEATLGAAEA